MNIARRLDHLIHHLAQRRYLITAGLILAGVILFSLILSSMKRTSKKDYK